MTEGVDTTSVSPGPARRALAIAAHPDDIEYMMAGTLLLLKEAGCEIHYFNLSRGNCGSQNMAPNETARVRLNEAKNAARILGATFHPPIANDLEIIYGAPLMRQIAAVIRQVGPEIILTHSPADYMEDHMETSRLVVTAAFAHDMPNFHTDPPRPPHRTQRDITIYHGMPHGLRDGLRHPVVPDAFIDVSSVHETKLAALTAHQSQQSWLQASQGMNSYLQAMEDMSREVGRMSATFALAEGWRRHSHIGFSSEERDPLRDLLGARYHQAPAAWFRPF